MRKRPILSLLYVAMFALFSCSKSNSSSLVLPPSSYNMAATVTKSSTAILFSATGPAYITAVKTKDICTITASDTSGGAVVSNFTFIIVNCRGIGTYTFDSSSDTKADYETTGVANTQTAFAYGTIAITAISGENISGTFSGTLTDGSVIAGGKFTAWGKGF